MKQFQSTKSALMTGKVRCSKTIGTRQISFYDVEELGLTRLVLLGKDQDRLINKICLVQSIVYSMLQT